MGGMEKFKKFIRAYHMQHPACAWKPLKFDIMPLNRNVTYEDSECKDQEC